MQRFSVRDISEHHITRWIQRAAEDVLDAIIPPRERSARTKGRGLEDIELFPTDHDLLGQRITTLMDYRKSAVHDLVQSLKYDKSAHAARLAAAVLADFLREEISSQRSFSARTIRIVPVPLHTSRTHERGYNQIALALQYLPSEFKDGSLSVVDESMLERTRATPPQTRLKRQERLSNVAGAFEATVPNMLDSHVYLIDDVTTTGATLVHAAAPLRNAGATVSLIALARA